MTTTMTGTGSAAVSGAAAPAAADFGSELKQRAAGAKQAAESDAKQAAEIDAKKQEVVRLAGASTPSVAGTANGAKKQGKGAKQEWQLPIPASRWGIAAAATTCVLCVLGVGLHLYAGPRSRFHLPAAEPIPISGTELVPESEPVESSESLEDALKSLEGAEPVAAAPVDIEGDFFHGLEDHIDVVEAHQPKDGEPRRAAKKPKRKVVETPAQADEGGGASEVDAEDALKKLEVGDNAKSKKDLLNDLVQKLTSSDSKTADEVVEKALKKSKKAKSEEGSKLSEEDKEKAKTILQETLEKLQSDDADHSDLREKLQTLLGKDGEDSDASEGKKKKKKKAQKEAEAERGEEDSSHGEFVKLLSGEKERKHDHSLADVKKEFQQDFAGDAKHLLCAGCKLVSARLTSELSTHDVHESESPAQMIAAKRRAIDATCSSFRHLQVAPGAHGLRIQAGDAQPDTPGTPDAPSRFCHALLEESKFDILTRLIQAKIPEHSYLTGASAKGGLNWERWLCAQRTRVCKRSEVRDEDEEQEL